MFDDKIKTNKTTQVEYLNLIMGKKMKKQLLEIMILLKKNSQTFCDEYFQSDSEIQEYCISSNIPFEEDNK